MSPSLWKGLSHVAEKTRSSVSEKDGSAIEAHFYAPLPGKDLALSFGITFPNPCLGGVGGTVLQAENHAEDFRDIKYLRF